ncbi:hypothetical protein [Pistricoccus aurantiacus]|uniref:hypothetical protein n=1 Tax=Pistricoccus aurantiacus TaxID=1883414 RepID=UPI00364103FA
MTISKNGFKKIKTFGTYYDDRDLFVMVGDEIERWRYKVVVSTGPYSSSVTGIYDSKFKTLKLDFSEAERSEFIDEADPNDPDGVEQKVIVLTINPSLFFEYYEYGRDEGWGCLVAPGYTDDAYYDVETKQLFIPEYDLSDASLEYAPEEWDELHRLHE